MSAELVRVFNIKVPKTVTFQTTADQNVMAYGGRRFRTEDGDRTLVDEWSASQLEDGVHFVVDAAASHCDIILTVTVRQQGTITATTSFTPSPPASDTAAVEIKEVDGVAERIWVFSRLEEQ